MMKNNLKVETPSYYAIIPANVRYDKNISSSQKLLYGEITALCSKVGICWASNSYFAELYDKTPKTISAMISGLAEEGYISVNVDKEKGNSRIISIMSGNIKSTIPKKMECYLEKSGDTSPEKSGDQYNNTSINIKYNKLTPKFESFYAAYPKKRGKEEAFKAFQKINPNEELLSQMLKAVDMQAKSVSWQKDNGQFIPYPATWLNGKRWQDVVDAPVKNLRQINMADFYDDSYTPAVEAAEREAWEKYKKRQGENS